MMSADASLSRSSTVAHSFVWASGSGLTYEPCEVSGCTVDAFGRALCGMPACPRCGRGGSNLSVVQLLPRPADGLLHCGCGHAWPPA